MEQKQLLVKTRRMKKEMEEEIKNDFIDVLKKNAIISDADEQVFIGKKYVFVYRGVKRLKRVVRMKFDVYFKGMLKYRKKKSIGTLYISISVR